MPISSSAVSGLPMMKGFTPLAASRASRIAPFPGSGLPPQEASNRDSFRQNWHGADGQGLARVSFSRSAVYPTNYHASPPCSTNSKPFRRQCSMQSIFPGSPVPAHEERQLAPDTRLSQCSKSAHFHTSPLSPSGLLWQRIRQGLASIVGHQENGVFSSCRAATKSAAPGTG